MTAAVCVTFDNLGEATELERGQWPEGAPLGHHPSVTRALPRVLDLLAGTRLRATFFVEGLNAELYPDTLRAMAAAGHEVACHGWRHERWADLDAPRERALLERAVGRLDALGLRPAGFRPPGGELTRASMDILRELGFAYCSPAGDAPAARDGIAVLPFAWPLVDAFHYLAHFGELRERLLGAREAQSPAQLRDAVADALRAAGPVVLVFHPFLADAEDRLEALRAVLEGVRAGVDAGALWCAPCREVAARR